MAKHSNWQITTKKKNTLMVNYERSVENSTFGSTTNYQNGCNTKENGMKNNERKSEMNFKSESTGFYCSDHFTSYSITAIAIAIDGAYWQMVRVNLIPSQRIKLYCSVTVFIRSFFQFISVISARCN